MTNLGTPWSATAADTAFENAEGDVDAAVAALLAVADGEGWDADALALAAGGAVLRVACEHLEEAWQGCAAALVERYGLGPDLVAQVLGVDVAP